MTTLPIKTLVAVVAGAAGGIVLFAAPAGAASLGYLDAGTGSMVIQAIVAGVAGFAVLMKLGWRRVLGFVSPKHRRLARELSEQRARERELAAAEAQDASTT